MPLLTDSPPRTGHSHTRALRAWLHTVRDRIGINEAAHLSAQLPELLRGIFYEGWVPADVPVTARRALIPRPVRPGGGCFAGRGGSARRCGHRHARRLVSAGQLDHVFALLPEDLRRILLGSELAGTLEADLITQPEPSRIDEIDNRLRALSDAVGVLVRGLEKQAGGQSHKAARVSAAQQAQRILVAQGLTDSRPPTADRPSHRKGVS
ncbi:DUF2267 domain-containing protein [Nocardia sp. CY41]|uniref:DUF2267 domain-containing protein n=1 Tax=Nocardia sp. CY41 TaxID=2608686 RepID=UPI00135BDE18|nr:DUF2267 domain-containing protein [Nocardia sp. CY41]